MTASPRVRIHLMLLLVMLLWAGNALVARAVRADVPPFTLAFLRWSGAALLLLPFAARGIAAEWPLVRRHWPMLLLLSIFGVGCFNALLYSGLRTSSATNAMLIQAAIPALVLGCNYLFFRTRALPSQIIGVLAAALGALLIIFRADIHALAALHFGTGDALILLGVICWSVYTSLLRKRPPLTAPTFLWLSFATGVVMMAPLAASEWADHPVRWTPGAAAGIAYVAIFPSIIAYFLYNHAVAQAGAAQAGQAISLQPLLGAFLAALLLGETLHGYHFAGMALILLGIAVAARNARAAE
ncbi:DMT family transporter [Sphingobium sp. DC-2]|uniref:DMT family transporter n=1 Tax=Sphingobium sp. DC-2 TaxID=1303256 RepID=UPI0004C35152|nr:DMT family transporter [Sphingobium sp. DC-2]